MRKRFTVWIALSLVAFFVLVSAGCGKNAGKDVALTNDGGAKANSEKTDTAQKIRIGLVMKTLTNPFFVEMEKGARKAEAEFGIELIVKTGAKETSIDQQIKIVEDMTSDKVDAIVIAPGSSTELIPALKKAQDAGIKIINVDNKLDAQLSKKEGLNNVPFISVDNKKAAYLSAKYISDKIKKPTEAVIIEGIRGADNAEKRKIGATNAFAQNKNIHIVGMETANWKIDEANAVIKKLYMKHPKIGAIFCANDMMALGVVHYLQETGKKNILLAGFDNLDEARSAIKNGEMNVTIDQKPSEQGYKGVVSALQLIHGEKVQSEIMIPVDVIDSSKIK